MSYNVADDIVLVSYLFSDSITRGSATYATLAELGHTKRFSITPGRTPKKTKGSSFLFFMKRTVWLLGGWHAE
jgi:hypothetical protein